MGFGDNRALDLLVRASDNREGLQLDAAEVAALVEALVEALDQGERGQILGEVRAALKKAGISKPARAAVEEALDSLAA